MIVNTIKELYEWAVKEGVENLDLYICNDEGFAVNCYTEEIFVDENKILL